MAMTEELESLPNGPSEEKIDGLSSAFAKLYGEPLFQLPSDLYIPPDALEVFLEAFEGPLDLLLYLIRKQNFNVLDIPMAEVTQQYLSYIDQIRHHNLELAAEYLLMAAMLIEIKSRMLLPMKKADSDEEVEDPRAELVRRLLEYERMKLAAQELDRIPQVGRDFQVLMAMSIPALQLPGPRSTLRIYKWPGGMCYIGPNSINTIRLRVSSYRFATL